MKQWKYALPLVVMTSTSQAAYVKLGDWQSDGSGVNWEMGEQETRVTQLNNGGPSTFFSGMSGLNKSVKGQFAVSGEDDDYVGFVLGYNAGEAFASQTDFLLIDWKKAGQTNGTLGLASRGLAISYVSQGLGAVAGGDGNVTDSWSKTWTHDSDEGVTELKRGENLGDEGWETGNFDEEASEDNAVYTFEINYSSDLVEVFIDDELEISLTAEEAVNAGIDLPDGFTDGGFGFYNFTQDDTTFGNVEITELAQAQNPSIAAVSAPATALLFGGGLAGLFLRRNRKTS
ncbi:PEP-CTERM sorting domain-containing protein [Alteromonas antoniana]|jgi:hypothetical protein|uniref:PEP-CTERM sorting domain-containing protein n=1 Tax=Alteromonas antoniana TaxID=2803813 RepID=UPI001C45EA2B|nr:PEP-CTERM sorting domain-containing protein [Alteromonas antoniana]